MSLKGKNLINKSSNSNFINNITCGDSMELLLELEDNSVDIVITDPPYFLDKMDADWDHSKVSSKKNLKVIKSLPAGMRFDRNQGKRLYDWYYKISCELFRILKPGGFFFSFSSPRLYHRLASAVDDAGFDIRDTFMWLYTQNQPKAMGLSHFVDKLEISKRKQNELKERLIDWKTPQLKSCFEPIAVAQKPPEKTFLENMRKYQVGLVNISTRIGDDMYPSNVVSTEHINQIIDRYFLVAKPNKREKGEYNSHQTVKPLALCEYLIKLTAFAEDAVVLDPFVGSGTSALAAKRMGKRYIGIDVNKEYIKIATRRLAEEFNNLKNSSPDQEHAIQLSIKAV